jgi:hypothetical protein
MEAHPEFNTYGGFSDTDFFMAGYTKDESGKWQPPTKRCDYCGKKAIGYCGKCEKIYYCSKECQKEQWKFHKGECK